MTTKYTIAIVGNPNSGKTTLFNALTGAKQRVGNWPGVTVERKTGEYRFEGADFEIVDLPGAYSLDVGDAQVSLDEKIARDYIHGGEAQLIINIVDASNLERNLYLTTQLVEMRVPMVVVLSMMDVAAYRGMTIDNRGLSEQLGCPVVPIVAADGQSLDVMRRVVLKSVLAKAVNELTLLRVVAAYQAGDRFRTWLPLCRFLQPDTARRVGDLLQHLAGLFSRAGVGFPDPLEAKLQDWRHLPTTTAVTGVVSTALH